MQCAHASAPCHRSKFVSDFVKKKNIKTVDWPNNNPDLHPIENLWEILKDKVADEHPTRAKDLKMAIKRKLTQNIIAEYCKHLAHSLPCRLRVVIKNKGGHTKYWIPTLKLANVTHF